MFSIRKQDPALFSDVWSPKYETDINVKGQGVERGARALTKQASADSIPQGLSKDAVFDDVYYNPGAGFKKLAFSMQTPLKDRCDYVSIGRKLLLTDEMPQGELPVYDLDISEFPAVVVGARGVPPLVEAHIQRIQIPTASYSISVAVHYEELQIRRYPAFNRAKERGAIAMAITEDDQVFALLDRAVAAGPNTVFQISGTDASADRGNFVDLFRTLSSRQLPLGAYVMHPWRYGDVLSWGSADLDQVSLNVIVESGQFGVLHGVRMMLSTRVNAKKIYGVTTPELIGPRRSDSTVNNSVNCKDTLRLHLNVKRCRIRGQFAAKPRKGKVQRLQTE